MALQEPKPIYSVRFKHEGTIYVAHIVNEPNHSQNLEITIQGSETFKNCGVMTDPLLSKASVYLKYNSDKPFDNPSTVYVSRPREGDEVAISAMTFQCKEPDDYKPAAYFLNSLMHALIKNSKTKLPQDKKVSMKIGKELETIIQSKQWASLQKV